ncbi:exopolysaccharide biosynthesis polyprenyl glycosylphosphotransferase, partial [Burkholderia sp. L27(2015)]|uniref:exopolysaccharide biosynthesis polyprenyl glycosylphosphotransferase n=1 Tax=Burkholderia sp. L27(2015) TaxID=1641858 RepID=UPI00131B5F3A
MDTDGFHSREPGLAVEVRFIDTFAVVVCLPLAAWIMRQSLDGNYLLLLTLALLFFTLFSQVGKLYGSWRLQPLWMELVRVGLVWCGVLGALLGMAFLFKESAVYSRLLLGVWACMVPSVMAIVRWNLRRRIRKDSLRGINVRVLAFVGAGPAAQRLAERLNLTAWMGLRVAGVYDDRHISRLSLGDMSLIGDTEMLLRDARAGKLDYVYITLPMHAEKRIVELVNALADTTVSVYVVPHAFIFDLMHASWVQVGGQPVISIYETPFFGIDGSLKRLEDLVLASLILVLISPLLLAVAIAIKLSSPGPVLFRQQRYGLDGQIVEVWKFRSMSVSEDGDVVQQAQKGDRRVTSLGRFLRRTSLDELPQFINVLQGRMSIV